MIRRWPNGASAGSIWPMGALSARLRRDRFAMQGVAMPADDPAAGAPPRRIYGRRRGRPLRPGQRQLQQDLLPQLTVRLPEAGPLDPAGLFATPPASMWLEIGFGAGEHLAAQAEAHPGVGFIGVEVFENGVARLVGEITRRGLGNIRVFPDDARMLLDALAAASLDRVFILFPDP